MSLTPGSRLGGYEIQGPLGAGGMGEVYRARDGRLERDVAIKVLPSELATDPSRLKRFEKEARAASALNHPNIVTIYEIGTAESVTYIAMERVEGKTLRELLFAGAIPTKKLLPIAAQIADGLARAHEAGIVHRDLKPENVMVTKDGLVKILDFGLAKRTDPGSGSDEGSHIPTETGTSPGVVLGTVGYMSPEQAAGLPVDFRSDQFAFGSVLYEMATGKRAFQKGTAVDTLSAILHEEPKPLGEINPQAPAPLRWIVERCLAKDPEGRYASTKDLARELISVRDRVPESISPRRETSPARRLRRGLLLGGILAVVAIGAWLVARSGRRPAPAAQLEFEQVTFGEHSILHARFAPDGESVVYSAEVGSSPTEVFLARRGTPESRSLEIRHADVKAISPSGQMALLLGDNFNLGTLAVASLAGGAPREMVRDARDADWSPDGKELAIVHAVGGRDRLEFPIGKVLYESAASASASGRSIREPRVSRGRGLVAFRSSGFHVVDLAGHSRLLGPESGDGLAWSPADDELWFTNYARGKSELRAISLAGKERLLASLPGDFVLMDVTASGRVLLERGVARRKVYGKLAGDAAERDLTYLDATVGWDLSRDGRRLLFVEESPGVTGGEIFVRTGTGAPVHLGSAFNGALSPDGERAITAACFGCPEITVLPMGAGQPFKLPAGDLHGRMLGSWLPDGKAIVFSASATGRKSRIYVQDVAGGLPRPITPEGTFVDWGDHSAVSPDGSVVFGRDEDRRIYLYPVAGSGPPRAVRGIEASEHPIQWSEDGRSVFVQSNGDTVTKVFLVDVASGERRLWKEFAPPDPLLGPFPFFVTPDGRYWVRNYSHWSSNLDIVEGVR